MLRKRLIYGKNNTFRRIINGNEERAIDYVYIAIADFVVNKNGTAVNTLAYNKDVLNIYRNVVRCLHLLFEFAAYLFSRTRIDVQTQIYLLL